ncbi:MULTISPECIES: hypothetical protein [unclassified Streptomyces]|nr:hypothetical protein [Streptomyces sp. NBC_01261]WSX55585.1 hypothetical protein OG504_03745 [Streptomyces sp. NBC_00986]
MHANGLRASGLDLPNVAIDLARRLEGMSDESDDPGLLDNA